MLLFHRPGCSVNGLVGRDVDLNGLEIGLLDRDGVIIDKLLDGFLGLAEISAAEQNVIFACRCQLLG